ncbi:MAG: hypothetical protein DMF90_12725 [Acidobacteria bacterium]|nr:MAG: hypothetical protein DMF90_12725 [Acidobacteriota bacterium]
MTEALRVLASAAVGGAILLSASSPALAQTLSRLSPLDTRQASFSAGTIGGTVSDDAGAPVEGAVVSALGPSTTVAVSDEKGLFEFDMLSPGPYLVRAYFAGHAASRPQIVQVRPNVRSVSSLSLHRANAAIPVLAAGVGTAQTPDPLVPPAPPDRSSASAPPRNASGNPEETAWRIRHARRSVLKDVTIPDELMGNQTNGPGKNAFSPVDVLGQVAGSSVRLASSLFSTTPLSGQVNLLTTGSFDAPLQLLSPDALSRNVAFLRVSAPVGDAADWSVRGALTRADLTSWIVAGSYSTRMPARHRYDVGLSYSTQRYDGANPLAVRDLGDGSRNAATVYGYDTIALTTAATLSYGASYARYDYLDQRNLISPRAELTLTPADRWRVSAVLSRPALAPGAEEFLPPGESGLWLPPQRTFSSIDPDRRFESERGIHAAVAVERDFGASTVIVRTFRQRVDDQLVAVFGTDLPYQPSARLGHYYVGNVSQAQADGFGAGFRTVIANRVHGSIGYTAAYADLGSADDLRYLLMLPSSGPRGGNLIHDVSTSIETEVPETATRVLLLYRVSNGFARPATSNDVSARSALDGRFDVQLRQSLPFMNFSNAKWEMLLAVRNFFREASADQFFYDELLVARPPKRLVGGVTLHF